MKEKKKIRLEANSLILIIMIILCCIVFSLINKNYFTYTNLVNVFLASTSIGLTAIGITFLMMVGGTDLSAGAVAAACGVFMAWGLKNISGIPWWLLAIICLFGAAIAGFINGKLVTGLKLVPFIATLVSQSIWKGIGYLICDGKPISVSDKGFQAFTRTKLLGITIPIYLMFVFFIIFSYILSRTKFGRSVFAIGGNPEAARLAGINSKKVITICYVMTSVFAGLAGIILTGRMNSGNPASNVNIHFDAITAANLGGVSMEGGVGSIPSVVLGVLLVQAFNSGLNMANVSQYWQYIAKGLLLLGSLSLDFYRQRMREKQLLTDAMKNL